MLVCARNLLTVPDQFSGDSFVCGGDFGCHSAMWVILPIELLLFSCIATENEVCVFNALKDYFVN